MSEEKNQKPQDSLPQEPPVVNTDFMKEKIKARPVNRRRLIRRTLITVVLAVLFGAIACVVFLALEPIVSRAINSGSEKPQTPVTFPEEASTKDEISPEDMVADDAQMQKQEAQEAAQEAARDIVNADEIRKQVLDQLETGSGRTRMYRDQYDSLSEIASRAAKSMVTVTGITSDYDWAGDAYENSGRTSGTIIAENDGRLLIVTRDTSLKHAEEIEVTFMDGSEADAQIRAEDTVTGFLVLSVDESDLAAPFSTNDSIAVAKLGSSARADLLGKPVIAVGSPSGSQGSVSYGIVTNAALPIDTTDSGYCRITTDIYGSTQAAGALVDLDGAVIGIIDLSYNSTDSSNLISAVGITEIKSLLENLSNAVQMPYFGIHGTDVPAKIHDTLGVPEGAYITRFEMDSPAMESGLQSGDVITRFNGHDIAGFSDLITALEEVKAESLVTVHALRQGSDGYEPIDFTVSLGSRLKFE